MRIRYVECDFRFWWTHAELSQVVNLSNAIKVACDFVSAENLDITEGLIPGLRAYRLRTPMDDILQLHTTVWFAWLSVKDYNGPVDSDRAKAVGHEHHPADTIAHDTPDTARGQQQYMCYAHDN